MDWRPESSVNNNNSTTTTTHSTSAARPNFEDDSHFHPSSAPSSYSAHDFFMSKQPQLQMADGLSYSEHSVREYARTAPMSMSDHGGNISYNHSSGSGYHSMMSSRDFMNRELMGTSYDDSFSYGNNSHMMNNSGAGFTTSSSSNHGLRNNTNASMGREEPQHTRHARRLYFGGIPPNYADEELLKMFLNNVISKGLNEENDFSYVVSVYINFKKCFAFVELKSIELTTACLELDGIVYRNSVLKVQRANEYKPDAISSLRSSIKLSLPPEVFSGAISIPPPTVIETNEPRFGSLIVQGPMSAIERGAVVLLGFPFDEGSRRSAYGRPGGATAPKIIRRFINKLGAHYNPEFELSIANVLIVDIGDIPVGLTLDEAHSRLALVIAEIVQRGGIPFIIGGSCDMSYFSAAGLMTITGGGLGVLNVTSQLNVKPPNNDNKIHSGSTFRLLLEDTRFCSPALRNGLAPSSPASCEGKFVAFGCQGTTCSGEQSRYVLDRNGKLFWLSKDIRTYSPPLDSPSPSVPRFSEKMCNTAAAKLFKKVLFELKEGSPMSPEGQPPTTNKPPRPVMIAFNLESMAPSVCPGVSAGSSLGIHAEEALEICFAAGADSSVVLFDISECNPDVEELRTCRFVADMFCSFVFGIATRTGQRGVSPRSSSLQRQAGHVQATLFKPPAIQSSSLTSISDPFDLSGQGFSAAVQQHQNELAFSSSQNSKSMSLNRPYSLGAPGQRSSSMIPGLQTVTEMFNGNEGGRSRLLTTHHQAVEDLPRSPTAGSHTSNLQPSW